MLPAIFYTQPFCACSVSSVVLRPEIILNNKLTLISKKMLTWHTVCKRGRGAIPLFLVHPTTGLAQGGWWGSGQWWWWGCW